MRRFSIVELVDEKGYRTEGKSESYKAWLGPGWCVALVGGYDEADRGKNE
jgi:hypothetical protein